MNWERFWSKTKPGPNGCVDWVRGKDRDGYGKFLFEGRNVRAHRFIYQMAVGDPGPELMHSCDRPSCVALQHLSRGTSLLNQRDAWAKGRKQRGEKHYAATTNEPTIREIRSRLASGETCQAIVRELGVTKDTVRNIGKGWKHVTSDDVIFQTGSKCGPLAAILVRQLKMRGARRVDLEHAFGLSCPMVNDIAAGRAWSAAIDRILRAKVFSP